MYFEWKETEEQKETEFIFRAIKYISIFCSVVALFYFNSLLWSIVAFVIFLIVTL